jgi:hypothetical protein
MELIRDAMHGAFIAAKSGEGRVWRPKVPFIAYMMMTIKGRGSDARKAARTRTRYKYEVRDGKEHDGCDSREPLGELLVLEQAAGALDILGELRKDPRINALIGGLLEGLKPKEIQEKENMTKTEYESARRQLLRRLLKLRPEE